jgi:alkylmercury lyase
MSELERARQAWGRAYEGLSQEEIDRRVRGFTTIVRGIARDGVVKPSSLAAEMDIDADEARQIFSGLQLMGMEVDSAGDIVGAAVTTRPTPHTLRIAGRAPLFAWCALDTLFLPGLIGEPALVESSCPTSGEAISLSVSPSGVTDCSPEKAVLTVFLPDSSERRTGPASPT